MPPRLPLTGGLPARLRVLRKLKIPLSCLIRIACFSIPLQGKSLPPGVFTSQN